jgi:hypothetical protein
MKARGDLPDRRDARKGSVPSGDHHGGGQTQGCSGPPVLKAARLAAYEVTGRYGRPGTDPQSHRRPGPRWMTRLTALTWAAQSGNSRARVPR